MKKSTKALIAATAAISLACIGTVSYAAWTASTSASVEATGSTGMISSIGGVVATPTYGGMLSGGKYTMNRLVPIDHTGTVSGTVKYWQFSLTCDATGIESFNYTVSGSLEPKVTQTAGTEIGLYWSTTEPTITTAGTEITANTSTVGETITVTSGSDNSQTVYVFLKSNTVDVMGASIILTFGATEVKSTEGS